MKTFLVFLFALVSISVFSQNREELYKLLKSAKGSEEVFLANRKISDYYDNLGMRDSSDISNKEMFRIATESKNDTLLGMAYNYLGGNFMNTGDYTHGLEYQFKALNILGQKNGEAACLTLKDIGVTYKYLKNYNEALHYLKKAEEQIPYAERKSLVSNRIFAHMAESLALGKIDSAIEYVQLAEKSSNKNTDTYGYARTIYLFASIYVQKGDGDLAEGFFKKCIAFSDSPRISIPYVDATIAYSRYLLGIGSNLSARDYALKSFAASLQSNNKLGTIKAASFLKTIYNALHVKDSAYYYSDIKDMYRDSIFNDQQIHQVQNLTFTQQVKEKEDETKLNEQKEERKHNLQYAAITIGLITFLIFFLLLSRSIIVKPKFIEFFGVLGLLAVFEFINLYIHPYLAHLTNDSPVFMLIILIAIGALLIPLHHKLEKWITSRMVEKNKKIRLDAAKKTIANLEG